VCVKCRCGNLGAPHIYADAIHWRQARLYVSS
jgi:hypothetical protein